MGGMGERMLRAARLDPSLYEEVERDASATGQALAVVVLSSIAAGLGTANVGFSAILLGTVGALLGWVLWAWLTYFIGTRFLPEPQTEASLGELLRTIGFASSPGMLRLLGFIPVLGGIIFFIANVWMLIAVVVAVRQALDYRSTGRAVGVCLIGFVVQVIVFALLFSLAGAPRGPAV